MTYKEKSITKEDLEKFLKVLDSDEGIRIDNDDEHIFINKTSKRYCIDISKNTTDEFHYESSVNETIDFIKKYMKPESKIFAY